jgi:alpha-methylacyl-CoA racemase
MRALEGIRVLDLTRLLPGAMATLYLADHGADVIKVEQPGTGDYARHLFAPAGEESPTFAATNRGKRSIALNLKDPRGRDAFLELCRSADVLMESFRPGVMDRLGLGYDTLRAMNAGLIYVALTGYGQEGPLRDRAGHDLNYLAMCGALDLNGERGGPPVVPNFQIADLAGGAMQTAMAVALALIVRERTGAGQWVDVSMTRGAADMLTVAFANDRHGATRGEGILSGAYACYTVYRCRDDRYIAVGALETKFFGALCEALGRADLVNDQYAPEPRQSELKSELAAIFAARDAAEWVEYLVPRDCCVTLVRTLAEAKACDWLRPLEPAPLLRGTPPERASHVPRLGEHNRELLPGE